MHPRRTRRMAVLATGLIVTAGLLAPSHAAVTRISTKVDINATPFHPAGDGLLLKGAVKSPNAKCRAGRAMVLAVNGSVVSTGKSGATGNFSIFDPFRTPTIFNDPDYPLERGTHRLTAKVKRFGTRPNIRECRPDAAVAQVVARVTESMFVFDDAADTISGQVASPAPCPTQRDYLTAYFDSPSSQPQVFPDGGTFQTDVDGSWSFNLPFEEGPEGFWVFYAIPVLGSTFLTNGGVTIDQCTERWDDTSPATAERTARDGNRSAAALRGLVRQGR